MTGMCGKESGDERKVWEGEWECRKVWEGEWG